MKGPLVYERIPRIFKGFRASEVHPHYGTPLHAIGAGGIHLEVDGGPYYGWTADSTAAVKDVLALFEFAMKRGADPRSPCPASCAGCVRFVVRCGKSVLYDLKEPVGGRSTLSLWLALSQQARKLDGDKPEQLPLASAFFDSILALLLHVLPKHSGRVCRRESRAGAPAMTEVPQAAPGLWRRVMEEEGPCDVVLACEGGEVRVHSTVVAHASKVLAAMLRWPRQGPEDSWRVPLPDRREAVEVWRVLVYTGLPPVEGVAMDLLLEVLDLSHRWQDHLFECGIVAAALARRVVDGQSCAKILEAAVAKDLPELRDECLAFARRSQEMRRAWEGGQFAGEVDRRLATVLEVIHI